MRRKYTKKRRVMKKRKYRARKIPRFGSPVTLIRHRYITTITADSTIATYGSFQFTLGDLPNSTEFTNLYDEYKIQKVVLTFIPGRNINTFSTNQLFGQIAYVVDHDDAAVPTSSSTLFQYPSCKIKSVRSQFSVTINPKLASSVYNGLTDAYSARSQYVDCAYADVPHYGFKYYMSPSGVSSTISYDIYARYYVSFKGVR